VFYSLRFPKGISDVGFVLAILNSKGSPNGFYLVSLLLFWYIFPRQFLKKSLILSKGSFNEEQFFCGRRCWSAPRSGLVPGFPMCVIGIYGREDAHSAA
jgi:hypothetical protein